MAKPEGWFSRRYQTAEQHMVAQATKHAKVEDYFARLEARIKARANRTPVQQLAHLDSILGKGKGAKRERARLNAQINRG